MVRKRTTREESNALSRDAAVYEFLEALPQEEFLDMFFSLPPSRRLDFLAIYKSYAEESRRRDPEAVEKSDPIEIMKLKARCDREFLRDLGISFDVRRPKDRMSS